VFAFTRHIRQTLGVTEPRNTGCCKRLLTVICKPWLHCAFWHCTLCYLALPGHEAPQLPGKQERTEPLGALNDAQ
jgi:hypothetical protein